MIDFPMACLLHQRFSKDAFYKNIQLSPGLKASFVTDIDKIYVEYGLSDSVLNLSVTSKIEEILFLQIILREKEFNLKLIETIARQNPHKLVFLLCYEDLMRIAIWQGKLYLSEWQTVEKTDLMLHGSSLDEIWDGFIEQIALTEEQPGAQTGLSVEDRLKRQERIRKLEQSIEKTEAAAWKEKQPHKRFELHQRVQKLKQELEDLKNG